MTTLSFAAVGGTRMESGVTLTTDHLLAVVFGGERSHAGLDDSWGNVLVTRLLEPG